MSDEVDREGMADCSLFLEVTRSIENVVLVGYI